MNKQVSALAAVESLLVHMRSAYEAGMHNISETEVNKRKFQNERGTSPWELFVAKADYSYFAARTLLSQGVHLYGLFCAHQCIEVYLKAFIRQLEMSIPHTHKLRDLLATARTSATSATGYLNSDIAETVCLRYEPFYEIARYPAQISKPKEGKWVWAPGVDEKILDHFVYQMRKLLILKPDAWDILAKQGHIDLNHVREFHPQFYTHFVEGNLNFYD